jgi:hypothetical protein
VPGLPVGRLSFTVQRKGGLAFFAAKAAPISLVAFFDNAQNYMLFEIDGKHLTFSEVLNGRARAIQKVEAPAAKNGIPIELEFHSDG